MGPLLDLAASVNKGGPLPDAFKLTKHILKVQKASFFGEMELMTQIQLETLGSRIFVQLLPLEPQFSRLQNRNMIIYQLRRSKLQVCTHAQFPSFPKRRADDGSFILWKKMELQKGDLTCLKSPSW